MSYLRCGSKIISIIIIFLGLLDHVLCNYPEEWCRPKPCARLKNTINYQGPICTSNNGTFTEEGIKACENMKATCPEFNQAECKWYTLPFPNTSMAPRAIPCCRLKYKASGGIENPSRFTWMEVYYTLQYADPALYDQPVYDIVEIHRKVKNHKDFPDREQKDFPDSVQDPLGNRGLTWMTDVALAAPLPSSANNTAAPNTTAAPAAGASPGICLTNETVPLCSGNIVTYLKANYAKGFNETQAPKNAKWEEQIPGFNVSFDLVPSCRDILIDRKRTRACQILYYRNAYYSFAGKGKEMHSSSFPYLEVQVYLPPNGSKLALRYALWSVEDPEGRDQFFSNDNGSCPQLRPS